MTRRCARGGSVRLTNSVDDYLDAMGPVDAAFVFGIAPRPGEDAVQVLRNRGNVNDAAASLAARAPDKIIGFMSVHPDEPDVMDEIERAVHDLKLRGMKLGPNYQGFDPLGANAFRVYGKSQEFGLPIVFHQGTSPKAHRRFRTRRYVTRTRWLWTRSPRSFATSRSSWRTWRTRGTSTA